MPASLPLVSCYGNCPFFKMWPECWQWSNKYGEKHAMLLIRVIDQTQEKMRVSCQARDRDCWILAKFFVLPVYGWDKFWPDNGQIDLLCWGIHWSGLPLVPCFTALQKRFSIKKLSSNSFSCLWKPVTDAQNVNKTPTCNNRSYWLYKLAQ